jgi:hypothetical protein
MPDDTQHIPTVDEARTYGEDHGHDQVIIITIAYDSGTYGYASWGRTKTLCDHARRFADAAVNAIITYWDHA